jgi:hypothetical protein
MTPLAFAEAGFPIIPVRIAQKPNGGWRKQPMAKWDLATTNEATVEGWWQRWPDALPGIPLARMGWAVVDADGEEAKKKVTGIGCLGPHSAIDTPSGGKHLVFAQPDPPIGKLTWCEDVEVLGTSCLLTCYNLEELKFPHVAPRAILPKMFWKPQEAEASKRFLSNKLVRAAADQIIQRHIAGSLVHALWQLDAKEWRNRHDEWLALMMGCKGAGIAFEDFVCWSTSDPVYARDAKIIRRKWDSVGPVHGGALWAALKAHGIKASGTPVIAEEPLPVSIQPTRNWRSRINCIREKLERVPTEGMLFSAACVFAEVIADTGKPKPSVATQLLESSARACGLWKEIGADEVRRTIANGLRHVEEKILTEEDSYADAKS